ncbi:GNAT family N-acetyltransferase [Paracoccus litorisediminis]|uniref:GNAT family N-acetyltransferase n=1 Tax=Paracoccus litorisediminis TaxID=2006130 RepID=UPI0037340461
MGDRYPRVNLRSPIHGDAEKRFRLGRSLEIEMMQGIIDPDPAVYSMGQAVAWFNRMQNHPCAWIIEAEDELVGELRFDAIWIPDRSARLFVSLFNDRHLGCGIGRTALHQGLDVVFNVMRLHRVDLRVLAANARAIRCFEACSFRREGIAREAARVGEAWRDELVMSILANEYVAPRTARIDRAA